jgi:Predicted hydrolases of HD superfamily
MSDYDGALDEIVFLLENYAKEMRFTTRQNSLDELKKMMPGYTYDPTDDLVREPLLEHVGATPVVATALYPYIDDAEVDLGRALMMLAVHDIGELKVGDEIVFTKNKDSDEEKRAALGLLNEYYHEIYLEAEAVETKTAKFAKSVDKIAPDFLDYITDADVTAERLGHFVGVKREEIVPLIVRHKRQYMEWNEFLLGLHDRLMERAAEKLGK